MKTLTSLLVLVSLVLFSSFVSGETIVPPGPVSGTWTEAGSPYLVQGEINIPTNNTLSIEPGVEVNFQGHYKFIIYGLLEAIGTQTDSILFTAADTSVGWHSLRFIDAQDSSHLSYCIVQYGKATGTFPDHCGAGIYGSNSSLQINDCTIKNNSSGGHGAGIACLNGGNSIIDNCVLAYNEADSSGGGIAVGYDANAQILNSTISHCTSRSPVGGGGGMIIYIAGDVLVSNCSITEDTAAFVGGGVSIGYSSPTIENCDISGNTAFDAGGIYIGMSTPVISRCTITDNSVDLDGGGIDIIEAHPIFENCTFSGNQATGVGSQIDVYYDGFLEMTNTIVEGNSTNTLVYFYSSTNASCNYSDFHNSVGNNFGGTVPTGLGVITGVNANGDPCDVYMNIFEDPDFVYPVQNDYRLSWGSACIDAGDPISPLDPDGTVCEIGAFCYDQSMFQRILLTPFDTPIEIAATGGSFNYAIQVTNIAIVSLNIDIWCDVTFPNGSIHGPVLGPFNDINVGSEATISRERTQAVPAGAPPGNYSYNAYAISESDTSFDSFTFVKLAADGSDWYSGWFNTGEDFGEFGGVALVNNLPTEYALHSPYPNPFNPVTTINYDLPKGENVSLLVYDVMGRKIAKLVDGYKSAGRYKITFNAKDLVSGVYFVRLEAGNFSQVQKVVLMK